VVPTAADVSCSVTPESAPVTVLLALVTVLPLMVSFASCAAVTCVKLAVWRPASTPAPPLIVTVLAAPVVVDVSTRCWPSAAVTTEAVTPGLVEALLIAEARPDSVLFVESSVTDIDFAPTPTVTVPVPSVALLA